MKQKFVDVVCFECGKPKKILLTKYRSSKSKKFFCDSICVGKSQRRKINASVMCADCEKPIDLNNRVDHKNAKFCNLQCAGSYYAKTFTKDSPGAKALIEHRRRVLAGEISYTNIIESDLDETFQNLEGVWF